VHQADAVAGKIEQFPQEVEQSGIGLAIFGRRFDSDPQSVTVRPEDTLPACSGLQPDYQDTSLRMGFEEGWGLT
jgi:hypothetical protein